MGVSTAVVVIIVALVAGSIGLWAYRRSTAQPHLNIPKPKPVVKPIADAKGDPKSQAEQWGVRISAQARDQTCPEVRKILGQEYPLDEKPSLPLRNCPFPHQCACYYTKLFDRRKEERRSGEERRKQGHRVDSQDRRSGKDRRKKKSDIDWA